MYQISKCELSSFQGDYNLLPVCEDSAGFVVIPKSHNTFKTNVKHNKDSIMLDQNEIPSERLELI